MGEVRKPSGRSSSTGSTNRRVSRFEQLAIEAISQRYTLQRLEQRLAAQDMKLTRSAMPRWRDRQGRIRSALRARPLKRAIQQEI
jgi:ATP-dependent Clp protease ATP-binding subunit ClpA